MNLPLLTLLEKLPVRPLHLHDDSAALITIRSLRFLTDDVARLEEGILYIGNRPPADAACTEKSALLCTCAPTVLPCCASFLPKENPVHLFHLLLEIMETFINQEQQLYDAIYKRHNLQDLVELCSKYFGNAAYIVDSTFKVLAIDRRPMLADISAIWKNLLKNGYLSYDIIHALRKSRELKQMESSQQAVLFKSKYFNNAFINYNIIKQGKILGHFFVVSYFRNITAGDLAYVNHLAPLLADAMETDPSYLASRGRDYENFLSHMLSGTMRDPDQIRRQLNALHWEYEGQYLVFVMQPDTDDNLTIATLGRQLEGIQSGKPILFEGFLTAIFPVADTNAMELILQKLRRFLKETGNAGAISDLFDGFYRTATYYSQARLTLSLSSRQLGCLYTYGEYAIIHLMKTADASLNLNMLCEKGVFRLRDYDLLHQTEYFGTLKIFLQNERNIGLTAELLHIHRNTLLYRIERIRQMTGMDLEDYRIRQRILLSFAAIEYLEHKNC